MEGELPFRKAQNPPPQAISRLEKTWFFELAMPPRGIFAAACGILLNRTRDSLNAALAKCPRSRRHTRASLVDGSARSPGRSRS
jgi:hypothetical protein